MSLYPLLQDVQAVLFDLDGTIYSGDHLIPGAERVLAVLRQRQIPFRFVTNSTLHPRRSIMQRLAAMGVQCAESDIHNPTAAAAEWLRKEHPGAPICLLVTQASQVDFEGIPQDEDAARFVIIGDMGDEWTYAHLNHAFRLVLAGAKMIALGKSRYWRAPDGLRLNTGPFVAALEYATHQEAIILGKPAPSYYVQALEGLNVSSEQALMVGDDIYTDIAGAQQASCRTILVQTGKFTKADLQLGIWPDAVIGSIAELV